MNIAAVKTVTGYLAASAGALYGSVQLACALGTDVVAALNSNVFG